MRYTAVEIKSAAAQAGFSTNPADGQDGYSPADIIAAIAMAESGGNPDAHALTSKESSWGVYQINLYAHPSVTEQCARALQCASVQAYGIASNGKVFTPWTMYKNGGYKQYLPIGGGSTTGTANPTGIPTAPPGTPENPAVVGQQGQYEGGSVLGIPIPPAELWKKAGIVGGVAMLAFAFMAAGVWGYANGK